MSQPLVTILTAPKSFEDPHIQKIQRNALRSWKALGSLVDVIVLGNDKGIKENAQLMGIRHYPDVRCNEKGTPLVSSMLEIGRDESRSPYLAIVNADVILFSDFIQSIKDVSKVRNEFLIIGQRWDMDVLEEVGGRDRDFMRLKKRVSIEAKLHPPKGSDYFVNQFRFCCSGYNPIKHWMSTDILEHFTRKAAGVHTSLDYANNFSDLFHFLSNTYSR